MGSIRSRGKLLFIDFRYRSVRCREQTKLTDTPANRKRLSKILDRIEAEILIGSFSYKDYFPKSKRVAEFEQHEQRISREQSDTPAFKDFSETWWTENEVSWKHSYRITLRASLDKHILPAFGEMPVSHIAKADILAFRANLAKIPRCTSAKDMAPIRPFSKRHFSASCFSSLAC